MPCVAGEQRCDDTNNFLEIDGFTCPGGETIGPQVKQEPVPTQNGAKISADFFIFSYISLALQCPSIALVFSI
jgi:hypothetical protein